MCAGSMCGKAEGVHRGAAECTPLTVHLQWWLQHIVPRPDHKPRTRLHLGLCSNKVSMVASIVTLAVGVSDVAAARSMHEASVPAILSLGVYSAVFAHVLFVRRLPLLQRTVALLLDTTARVEPLADAASKARMERTARRGERLLRQLVVFSMGIFLQFPTVYAFTSDPQSSLRWVRRLQGARPEVHPAQGDGSLAWPEWSDWTNWLHWAAFAEQAVGLLCSFTAFYTMLPLVIVVYSACADLHTALAHSLKTRPCVPNAVAVQAGVLRACLVADQALADLMPHLLVVSVVMPLFSTAELMVSGLGLWETAYSLATAAPILVVFVPLCEAGDRLDRARRGVADCAARGPWIEEPPSQRRLRIGVMQAASGRGALVRGSGIGPLDRPACANALRSWFSFLQVIINVRRETSH